MPIVELSNGLKVGNFSSPHSFTFEDGSVLEACTPERSKLLSMQTIEAVLLPRDERYNDICMSYLIDDQMDRAITEAIIMWEEEHVDIVIVPFICLQAMKDQGYDIRNLPFRVIRITLRISKICSIDKFCVL